MARAFLKVYFDFDERTEELSDTERARLLLAMYYYAKTGEKKPLTGNERFLFATFKGEIDRDIAAYNAKVDNGNKGGRPSNENLTETEKNLKKPNETEENLNQKNKNKNKTKEDILKENSLKGVKEKTAARFTPPTTEEVTKYCQSRKNDVDPQRFVDFYASKGWKIGSSPMKDWKAAVRTWEQRSDAVPIQKPKLVRAQMYEQRDYDETEMEERLGVRDLFKEA